MIETIVDSKNDLTIHKCSGSLTEEGLINTIHSLYDGTPTLNIVWDFSDASVEGISSSFVRRLAKEVRELGAIRPGGKSAVVAPKDLIFGLARMFQIMTDEKGFPFTIKVFRSFDEAMQWLLANE